MAFLGSLFNNGQGAGYQAQGLQQPLQQPQFQSVDLTQPGSLTAAQQANNQYQSALGQTGQANQQAQGGINQQQAFLQALQGQNGIGNQQSVFNQQQGLSNQLQGVANGTGPNPAQAQLAQTTGANVANQAALMAGQRGTGANAGLLARQAAQQGASTQQQAAGQAATLQAQQSLGALQQLQGQQANMASVAGAQVGQQAGALGQTNSLLQSQQQQQLAQQQAAASQQGLQLGQVNTQNQQQLAQAQGLNQANLGMSQNINQINAGMQQNLNSVNAGIAQGNQAAQAGLASGALQSVGGLSALLAQGGEVKHYADGDMVDNGFQLNSPTSSLMNGVNSAAAATTPSSSSNGPQSFLGKMAKGIGNSQLGSNPIYQNMAQGAGAFGSGVTSGIKNLMTPSAGLPDVGGSNLTNLAMGNTAASSSLLGGNAIGGAGLGVMPAAGSSLAPTLGVAAAALAKGGPIHGETWAAQGKVVPGQAQVKGDSLKNDIVDAKLSPGEIIIPRSVAQSKNAPQAAAKFVQGVIERKHRKNG